MHRHRTNRAFTLIELLVVVAIIAVLISILLPSLSRAREIARQTKCLSILKQYAAADAFYLTEYNSYHLPYCVPGQQNDAGQPYQMYWQNTATRSYLGVPVEGWIHWGFPRGMICPSADKSLNLPSADNRYVPYYSHSVNAQNYGLNDSVRSTQIIGYWSHDIVTPSEKIFFADAIEYKFFYSQRLAYAEYGEARWTPNAHAWRHQFDGQSGLTNVLFFDGHADTLTSGLTDDAEMNDYAHWDPYAE